MAGEVVTEDIVVKKTNNEKSIELTENSELEATLKEEVSTIEEKAQSIVITNDVEYNGAVEACQEVKAMKQQVVDYWEPMRKSTYDAYTNVNKHKKAMVTPLENAEKILKGKIADYQTKVAEERKAQEEAIRAMALKESERIFKEAIEAEEAGDLERAQELLAQAESYDKTALTATVAGDAPKAQGATMVKTWEITSIDPAKVPINFNGMVIRPVDESAVLALVKASKGQIQIPGIEFKETYSVRISTGKNTDEN